MKRFNLADFYEQASLLLIGIALLIFAAIPAVQTLLWFKTGIWQSLPTKDVISTPHTGWLGIQKILNFLGDEPFAVVGGVGIGLCGWWANVLAEREREREQLKASSN